MSHVLSIEIPPVANPKILRVFDTSIWDTNITVAQTYLDIIPPGLTSSITFTVARGFDKLYNASLLNIYPVTNPALMANLPDGIYILRLTVESQWVEYNHLRQTCLLKDYYKALCSLNFYPCDTIEVDLEEKRKELQIIKSYIDAAVAKVEWCDAPNEGMELHLYARKLLSKFSLEKCKNC